LMVRRRPGGLRPSRNVPPPWSISMCTCPVVGVAPPSSTKEPGMTGQPRLSVRNPLNALERFSQQILAAPAVAHAAETSFVASSRSPENVLAGSGVCRFWSMVEYRSRSGRARPDPRGAPVDVTARQRAETAPLTVAVTFSPGTGYRCWIRMFATTPPPVGLVSSDHSPRPERVPRPRR